MTGIEEMIFVSEIVLQAKIAQRAAKRLRATHRKFDQVETWCSIQSILGAVGNISKMLWPSPKFKVRGEKLRQLLKIEDNNSLSSRTFRNHFEHYDERVGEYFEGNPRGLYTDLVMNPSFRCEVFNDPPMYTHRGYNSYNNSVVFRSETLYLDPVLKALDKIVVNCKSYGVIDFA